MEEMPGRENFASDGHVLSPAKEVLMAVLERAAQGAGGSLGAKAPPGGRDQLAVSNLVEEFGLIGGGHREPIHALRCHDAQTGTAHVEVVLLKL